MKIPFLLFFIFSCLPVFSYCLSCKENEIENCIECGTGVDADKCKSCEEKYFLALKGEKCIKCDDTYYGMVGCNGTCTFMKDISNVKCQDNSCKSGYYELTPGYCAICSLTDQNCLDCSYSIEKQEFRCLECKDDYFVDKNGLCQKCGDNCKKCTNENFCLECNEKYTVYPDGKCYDNIENCKIGVYSIDKQSPICKECDPYYYLNSENVCQICKTKVWYVSCEKCHENSGDIICDKGSILTSCSYAFLSGCNECLYKDSALRCTKCEEDSYSKYYISSDGKCRSCQNDKNRGNCQVCNDDINAPCDSCYYKDYALKDDKCVPCTELFGNLCAECSEKECLKCRSDYGLLDNNTCSDCTSLFGSGCSNCGLSPYNLKPYCIECKYNYFLGNDGKCKSCVEDGHLTNCNKCEEIGKNGIICTSCIWGYYLIDGKCIESCGYYQINDRDGECRSCSDEKIGLNNCKRCQKLNNNEYECIECNWNYILSNGKCLYIEDEEIAICTEIENISSEDNPIYSCINCPSNNYIPFLKEDGAKICLKIEDYPELKNCESGIKNGDNNYICNKCALNSQLKFDNLFEKNICECNDGFYFDNTQKKCIKCSEKDSGCLKCHISDKNSFICDSCDNRKYAKTTNTFCVSCHGYCAECVPKDDEYYPVCVKYEEPYFFSNNSKVESCSDYINKCGVCSYTNEEKNELKCDKCLDYYFMNKDNVCEECYVNENINSGCLICTDDEEKLKNIKCDICRKNYFLTEENICEFCLSEKNGGNYCEECGYITINENNEEKTKIGCIKCFSPEYILMNGKCYPPIDNCLN